MTPRSSQIVSAYAIVTLILTLIMVPSYATALQARRSSPDNPKLNGLQEFSASYFYIVLIPLAVSWIVIWILSTAMSDEQRRSRRRLRQSTPEFAPFE